VDPLGQRDVAQPRVVLEQAQQAEIESIELKNCDFPASKAALLLVSGRNCRNRHA
jgi:hypothetical protein